MGKVYRTTRIERAAARRKREKDSGQLVPVNVQAIQDLLRGQALARIARKTGVPRRTLDHLRHGRVARTRYRLLQRLAAHFQRDVAALMQLPGRAETSVTLGAYASQARADMTLRRLAKAGVAQVDDLALRVLLERFHDLSTFRAVLGAQGLPIWELNDTAGWRPLELRRRKLEQLKARFADLVHELFKVVVQASNKEPEHGIQVGRLRHVLEQVVKSADADLAAVPNAGIVP